MKIRTLFIILLTSCSFLLYSQDCKIDLSKSPKLATGYSFSQLNKTFEQSLVCKIVFSEGLDTLKYKRITTRLTSWFLNNKAKREFQFSSTVRKIDSNCTYLFIGLFNDFSNLKDYKLPLSFDENHWSLGKITLNGKNDAIVIINSSANCLAVLGNTYEGIENIYSRWLGYYDFYILQDNKIRYFGNLKNGKFNSDSLVDLDLIRKENYSRIIENDFIKARFSCKFENPYKYQSTLDSLNEVFNTFCKLFKTDMPSQKLEYFIHYELFELNIVSGSPKPGTTSGLVIDGFIHSVGIDLDLLTHEGVHFIFNQKIKFRDQFFNEGIPGAFGLYLHPDQLQTDCKLILDYIDYDFYRLITGGLDFYKAPYKNGQCLSYQISGLFVKYLIDNWGIDKTIEFYKYPEVNKGFEKIFNKPLDSLIQDWKQWIMTMSCQKNNTVPNRVDGSASN
ncbi:MAG: hypothetical protein NTY07_17575 [Bacteroidia bacterium]|nr:hypothetical protein [Bacteroidia bacterium]